MRLGWVLVAFCTFGVALAGPPSVVGRWKSMPDGHSSLVFGSHGEYTQRISLSMGTWLLTGTYEVIGSTMKSVIKTRKIHKPGGKWMVLDGYKLNEPFRWIDSDHIAFGDGKGHFVNYRRVPN